MELSCLIFLFATYLGSCAGKETNVTETEDSHTSKGTVKNSNFHDLGVGGGEFGLLLFSSGKLILDSML